MFRFLSLLLAVVLGSSLLMLIAGSVVCADEPSDGVVESGAGDLESKAEKLPWSRWDMKRLKATEYRWLDSQSIVGRCCTVERIIKGTRLKCLRIMLHLKR